MIIATMFLKALKAGKKSSIGKAVDEIRAPTKRKDMATGPPHVTSREGNVIYADFKRGKKHDTTEAAYKSLEKEVAPEKAKIAQPQKPLSERVKSTIGNIPNIVRNAYDNSVGYGIAKYQNFKTTRALKKDSTIRVGYIEKGLAQNIGAGRRDYKEMKKRGIHGYHLKSHHNKSLEEAQELRLDQVRRLHKKGKIVDAHEREDVIRGHSSGGNGVIYAAGDKRTKDLGIKYAQAIAPTPYGLRIKTIGQKAMGTVADLSVDDVGKSKIARENALKMHKRKPLISVDVVAGKHDGLVPVEDTAYKYADKHHIIHHPKSTHFGTSGSNRDINKILVDILMDQISRYKGKEYEVPT